MPGSVLSLTVDSLRADKLDQKWFDYAPQARIRISRPTDWGRDIQRAIERVAEPIGELHARLLRHQHRGTIIRMATKADRFLLNLVKQRPKIGVEPIAPHHQLVELSASRDVLIVKYYCPRYIGCADQVFDDELHQFAG